MKLRIQENYERFHSPSQKISASNYPSLCTINQPLFEVFLLLTSARELHHSVKKEWSTSNWGCQTPFFKALNWSSTTDHDVVTTNWIQDCKKPFSALISPCLRYESRELAAEIITVSTDVLFPSFVQLSAKCLIFLCLLYRI